MSTRCAITARGPSTAPPWLPSALDSVTVDHDVVRAGEPGGREQPAAARSAHPQPVRLVDDAAARPGPRHTACSARQRGELAVDAVHALGDDQRARLVRAASARVDGAGRRRAGRPRTRARESRQASTSEAWFARVGDDQRARPGQRGDGAQVGARSRRRTPAPPGVPTEVGELGLQLGVQRGGAGDQPGAGRARAPGARGRDGRRRPPAGRGRGRGSRCPRGRGARRRPRAGAARGAGRRPSRRSACGSSQASGCGCGIDGTPVTLGRHPAAAAATIPARDRRQVAGVHTYGGIA